MKAGRGAKAIQTLRAFLLKQASQKGPKQGAGTLFGSAGVGPQVKGSPMARGGQRAARKAAERRGERGGVGRCTRIKRKKKCDEKRVMLKETGYGDRMK